MKHKYYVCYEVVDEPVAVGPFSKRVLAQEYIETFPESRYPEFRNDAEVIPSSQLRSRFKNNIQDPDKN